MTQSQPHIAVAMTVHNRRETTLACLRSLFGQADTAAGLTVYLVDDGCTDGTGPAVQRSFPDCVVIPGTGNLFWGGGMALAMSEAIKHPCDFILWLNDDVVLRAGAIRALISTYAEAMQNSGLPAIIAGAMTDPTSGKVTYAGFRRRNRWHPAQVTPVHPQNGMLVACDAMNGNCVLIPRAVVDAIGPVDAALVHRYGDIDYGYRARRAGFDIVLAPEPVGTCSRNPRQTEAHPNLTPLARWNALTAPSGIPLRPMFRFLWRHGGVLGALAGSWSVAKLTAAAVRGP